jgi:hypothetical protein
MAATQFALVRKIGDDLQAGPGEDEVTISVEFTLLDTTLGTVSDLAYATFLITATPGAIENAIGDAVVAKVLELGWPTIARNRVLIFSMEKS